MKKRCAICCHTTLETKTLGGELISIHIIKGGGIHRRLIKTRKQSRKALMCVLDPIWIEVDSDHFCDNFKGFGTAWSGRLIRNQDNR